MTKHDDYTKLDLTEVRKKVSTPILIDGRNAFNSDIAVKAGFTYKGLGKGEIVYLVNERI